MQRGYPALLPELAPCFEPIRGQMLATEPLPPLFPMGMAVDWGSVYWRQAGDGSILLGGYRGLDPEPETGYTEALIRISRRRWRAFCPKHFPAFRHSVSVGAGRGSWTKPATADR